MKTSIYYFFESICSVFLNVCLCWLICLWGADAVNADEKNIFADFQDKGSGGIEIPDFFPLNRYGANGLLRSYSSLTPEGNTRQVRLALMGEFYKLTQDFPTSGESTQALHARLNIQYAPLDALSVFVSSGLKRTNQSGNSNLLLSQAPVIDVGTQWTLVRQERFYMGALYKAQFRPSVDSVSGSSAGLNHDLLALSSFALDDEDQFWMHVNLGYRIDNNLNVGGTAATPRTRHLLDIYPIDPYLFALGLEYRWEWGLTGIEYSFDYISGLAWTGQPQRVSWSFHGFVSQKKKIGVQAGFDIGLSKADFSRPDAFQEATYNVYLGANYLLGSGKKKDKNTFNQEINVFEDQKKIKKKQKKNKKTLSGGLKGVVSNIETGDPIAGVEVKLCNGKTTKTNGKGVFDVKALPQGLCDLIFQRSGFDKLEDSVEVIAGDQAQYDFGMLVSESDSSQPPTAEPSVAPPSQNKTAPFGQVSDETHSSIELLAKDSSGNPIPAVIVFVKSGKQVKVPLDASGQKAMNVKPGTYEVFATFGGAESSTKYVMLEKGDRKRISFVLNASRSQGLQVQAGNTLVQDQGKFLKLDQKVAFQAGKATLTDDSKTTLNALATFLQKHQQITRIEIAGHTDNVGSSNQNLKLSQSRAERVKTYLVKQGVDGTRIRAVGYGEDFPIADNGTSPGRNTNRRVEFKVLNRS